MDKREQVAKKSNHPIILSVILSIPAVFIAAFKQSPLPVAPSVVHVVSLVGCIVTRHFLPHVSSVTQDSIREQLYRDSICGTRLLFKPAAPHKKHSKVDDALK
jgi:hypothetical protein